MSDSKITTATHQLANQATQGLDHAIEQTTDWAQQGVDGVRDAAHQLQAKAVHASDNTVHFIQHEPIKAMLMAAATGAALMALIGLMTKSSTRP